MAREIFNPDPDPVEQFNDLISGFATRDHTNRPLGDVVGHAIDRLATCFALIEAASLLGEIAELKLGARDKKLSFNRHGNPPQDRQGTTEYPAAHLSPCNLVIRESALLKPATGLYAAFDSGIVRGKVASIMAETQIVHVIVNRADSRIEGARRGDMKGFAHILAESCNLAVMEPRSKPREIFMDCLVPDFKLLCGRRLQEADAELFAAHPDALSDIRVLVDPEGRPLSPVETPSDNRIHAQSPAAWRANRLALRKVLEIYHATPAPSQDRLRQISQTAKNLGEEERRHVIHDWRRR